jgi:hypothetical protein
VVVQGEDLAAPAVPAAVLEDLAEDFPEVEEPAEAGDIGPSHPLVLNDHLFLDMRNKLNQFVEALKMAMGDDLQAVVLYGPACDSSRIVSAQEVQVMILCKELKTAQLDALIKPVNRWMRQNYPMPKLFTPDRLMKSTDVFPIECLELSTRYEVLYGEDLISGIEVSKANLRLQLETEFKGKLLQLRESYVLLKGSPKALARVMTVSLSTFESLFRALLILLQDEAPENLVSMIPLLDEKFSIDTQVLNTIEALRTEPKSFQKDEIIDLFVRYLKALEDISDAVDVFEF